MAEIDRLLDIMARLRDPQTGCPWDVEQTFSTIAPYTIEEAYEVADSIEREAWSELPDELGDLTTKRDKPTQIMQRQAERLQDLFRRIRSRIPGAAIRTTLIVGFPGETEADFQELMAFVEAERFDHLGVFTYSDADDLPGRRPSAFPVSSGASASKPVSFAPG